MCYNNNVIKRGNPKDRKERFKNEKGKSFNTKSSGKADFPHL